MQFYPDLIPTDSPRQSPLAWAAISGLILLTIVCLLLHVGGILRLLFPASAFLVAVFLYWQAPILYVGFAWWIAFLSPFVRRWVDYQSGWVDPSPVLLAPFLVLLVTLVTFIQYLPRLYHRGGLPFLLAIGAVFYALCVGLVKQSPTGAIVATLNWLTPILFGIHLFIQWQDYPRYQQNLQRVFLWGVLITGGYGIYQYLAAPEWDCFWLINTEVVAFGTPEPLGMRVFSTMNSPGPFAVVMMAGLLLLFTNRSGLRFPGVAVGYLAFLLSLVRSAWLGWVIAVISFIPTLKPKFQMQLIITVFIMAVCVLPLVTLQPFSEVIASRLSSFTTGEDVSYAQRLQGYNEIWSQALSEMMGKGLGYTIESNSLGSNDSGILSIFLMMGWAGAIPYFGSLFLLFVSLFYGNVARSDPFMNTARAISLGVFAQIGLGSATAALSGVVLWGFAGIALAGQKYAFHQQAQAILQTESFSEQPFSGYSS